MKFLVVISALVALSSAAPQLLYGGYPYAAYPSSLTYTHAVPTTVKKVSSHTFEYQLLLTMYYGRKVRLFWQKYEKEKNH